MAPPAIDSAAILQPAVVPCRTVLMVGTCNSSMGGISTVVRGYEASGLFKRFKVTYLDTHADANRWRKLWIACAAWVKTAFWLITLDAPLVHILLAARASFWRKAVICLLARLAQRPYILHVHGAEFMVFYDKECGPIAKRFVRWIFASSALVIAVSPEWREELLRISATPDVIALRNGVALPDLSGTAEIRRRSKYILSLGRLGRRKGTFDLVAAFSRIAAERPEWRLICAGHGDVAQTRSLAKEVGIADRVECPGWIDSDTAQQLLAAATVFALPSRMEGLPMALLEAMSWRLPVVTSPVGGIPQLVRHDYNGLLVAPGDVDALAAALGTLMDDEVARERLAGAARATITTEFSRDEIVGQLGRVYRRFGIPARDPAAAAPQ